MNGVEQEQEDKAQATRIRRAQELYDLKTVMSTPEGARFIYRLINNICAYDRILAQNSGSMTYFDLGERNVGRIVKGEVYQVALERYQEVERDYLKSREAAPDAE